MKNRTILIMSLLLGFAPGIAGAAPPAELKMVVAPAAALYGEPFSWKVTGLRPGELVTVTAVASDARKIRWESAAVFAADTLGAVDLAVQAPVSGSYAGVDIFGLLWSMKPVNADPGRTVLFRDSPTAGWIVDLTAENPDGRKATARFRCLYQKPDSSLVRVPLEQDGLAGVLYHPAGEGPFPGVIILGGSEGGLFEPRARGLAANGFAALTLAYFNYPGLPDELVEIPLEYFDRAIAWLQGRGSGAARGVQGRGSRPAGGLAQPRSLRGRRHDPRGPLL